MEIKVKRIARKPNYTIGRLYVDGVYFCDTLEDTDRGLRKSMTLEEIKRKKVYGQTAIPMGTYRVSITYSPTFKKLMPLLIGVPGYEGVRIHPGNTPADTLGCILVGENKEVGKVLNSRATFNKLYEKMKTASPLTITIE